MSGNTNHRVWSIHESDWLGMGVAGPGYALAWFLVNDRVKLAAYRIFDRRQPSLLAKGK